MHTAATAPSGANLPGFTRKRWTHVRNVLKMQPADRAGEDTTRMRFRTSIAMSLLLVAAGLSGCEKKGKGVTSPAPSAGPWVQTNGPSQEAVYAVGEFGPALLIGTVHGILRSTDHGATWSAVSSASVWAFASQGSQIFAGTREGVVRSTDQATSIY